MCRQWLVTGLLVSFVVTATWAAETKVEVPAAANAKGEVPAPGDAAKPKSPNPESSPNARRQETSPASAEQLELWIQELVHPKFAVRQAASQKLVQSGKAGIEAVAGAALTDDLELATRCLSVLSEGLSSKREELQQAARTALQNLAQSENKSVARRARSALDGPGKLGVVGGRFPGGLQGNFQQLAVQINNGVRQIQVTENGKEIVIKDNNGKDISVTTTETVNGQKVTKSVAGKDEVELKKNHAEAYELFEKYTKGGNGIRINVEGNAIGNGIIIGQPGPGQPRAPGLINRPRMMINPIKAAEALGEVDKLRQKLEESNERLSKAAESDKPDPADLKAISAEIKTLTKRLAEIKSELGLP